MGCMRWLHTPRAEEYKGKKTLFEFVLVRDKSLKVTTEVVSQSLSMWIQMLEILSQNPLVTSVRTLCDVLNFGGT